MAHLTNAARRTVELARLERENSGASFGPGLFEDLRSEWLSATVSSAFGAEAFFNEFAASKGRDPDGEAWRTGSLGKRAERLLADICDRSQVSSKVKQNIDNLQNLRDAIVHYKTDDAYRYPKTRGGLRFVEQLGLRKNPLVDTTADFFPIRCVSSAYARWSIEAALDYIDEVLRLSTNLGFDRHLRKLRDLLTDIEMK